MDRISQETLGRLLDEGGREYYYNVVDNDGFGASPGSLAYLTSALANSEEGRLYAAAQKKAQDAAQQGAQA